MCAVVSALVSRAVVVNQTPLNMNVHGHPLHKSRSVLLIVWATVLTRLVALAQNTRDPCGIVFTVFIVVLHALTQSTQDVVMQLKTLCKCITVGKHAMQEASSFLLQRTVQHQKLPQFPNRQKTVTHVKTVMY